MKNYNIRACFLACLFFAQFSFAKIIKDDHYSVGSKKYSWKEVCKKLVHRDSPLIEKVNISTLDCMGTKVSVFKFCDEVEGGNPYLSRAIVGKNVVICHSAKRVIIKWECEGKKDKYCKDKDIGCFLFKEKLARRLKLAHGSLVDNKYLNCYYDTQVNTIELNQ